jgi:hypothetical protein
MIDLFQKIICRYVPEKAIAYCVECWKVSPFSFKVSKRRRSKIGDYRFNKKTNNHEISVNGNLNPYAFLITYIHEVAHLVHYLRYGNNQPPHGMVWKQIFREMMEPVLSDLVFPPEVLKQLRNHMKNPKASSQSDPKLTKLLRQYDTNIMDQNLYLEDLTEGETFHYNGRLYTKLVKRRTRALCIDDKTGRKYLISEMVRVAKKVE